VKGGRKITPGLVTVVIVVVIAVVMAYASLLISGQVRKQRAEATKRSLDQIDSAQSVKQLQSLVGAELLAPDLIGAGAKQIADDLQTKEQRLVLTPAGIGKKVLVVLDEYGMIVARVKLYDAVLEQLRTCPRYLRVTLELPIGRVSKIQLAGFVGDDCEYTPTELAKRLAGPVKFKAELKMPQGKRTAELALRTTVIRAVPPRRPKPRPAARPEVLKGEIAQ